MEKYNPGAIEPKWQAIWEKVGLYRANDPPVGGPKKYILIEFPYPSGERLHVGHGRSYTCLDSVARYFRMKGFNVLYPIGWDAFGLPAENYAIKTGINPQITTKANIANARTQAKSWGLSFDWSREINTTDPNYYKWTQWIFLKLLEKGLAYRAEVPVNWCPSCKTNLADEEVLADGTHERCGQKTEKRRQKQWLIKITAYAERLLKDLDLVDFREDIRRQQINWIGKKEGIVIDYEIASQKDTTALKTPRMVARRRRRDSSDLPAGKAGVEELRTISVFTTAPVNFGMTFIVLAPEHKLVKKIIDGEIVVPKENKEAITKYVKTALNKSEQDRISEGRAKTGAFTGLYAINRINNTKVPVWVTDFVLGHVGTGAVQGCPGHDRKDFQFAKQFKLPIIRVIVGPDGDISPIEKENQIVEHGMKGHFVNSEFLNGLEFEEGLQKTMDYFEKKGWGKRVVTYHLHDWVFSRQHYWGEPIPIVFCPNCARSAKSRHSGNPPAGGASRIGSWSGQDYGFWPSSPRLRFGEAGQNDDITTINGVDYAIVPVPEEQLPVKLPYLENYQPSGTGESPLAKVEKWVNVACPKCDGLARRETDTMPNWAGSNWYYLGYLVARDLKNRHNDVRNNIFSDNKDIINYWMPVDLYNGGMEHTTLHLLYSRFIYKFLYDLGAVSTPEPYAKRRSHGVVLGPDGQKMSKSRGNVVNPDEAVALYGADTFRLYEAFMGPFDQMIAWNEEGVEGCFRFLKRVWQLISSSSNPANPSPSLISSLHRTIKKVGEDIEALKFNTAIAAMMKFTNKWQDDKGGLGKEDLEKFLLILSPFAPHITEELWSRLGEPFSINQASWPKYDEELIKEEKILIVIEVDGKVRDRINVKCQMSNVKCQIEEIALKSLKVQKYLNAKKIRKVVFVPGRLINFVI